MFVGHICKQTDLTNGHTVVQPSPLAKYISNFPATYSAWTWQRPAACTEITDVAFGQYLTGEGDILISIII